MTSGTMTVTPQKAHPSRSRTRSWWSPRVLEVAALVIGAFALALLVLPVRVDSSSPRSSSARGDATMDPSRQSAQTRGGALATAADSALHALADTRALMTSLGSDGARMPSAVLVDSTTAAVVQGNVLSSTRRAPRSRFTPPGMSNASGPSDASSAAGAMTPPSMAAGAPGKSGGADSPRLVGIVTVDGARRALIATDATAPAQLFGAGERRGALRVLAIEDDRVRLSLDGRAVTLRLVRSSPADSTSFPP